jgi:hypothetical protein
MRCVVFANVQAKIEGGKVRRRSALSNARRTANRACSLQSEVALLKEPIHHPLLRIA